MTIEKINKKIAWFEEMKTWIDPADKQGLEIIDELIRESRAEASNGSK